MLLPHGLAADEARAAYVRATLERCGGNKAEAARRRGVSRNTIAKLSRPTSRMP